MSNLSGQSLGRYHILEPLGEGGMAIVYKAYDTRLENEVAVKVIRTERLSPEILQRALKRFEREAKSLAQLTHPNIVHVLDYGEHAGQPYLVMPYVPGGTLKQLLNGKPMQWQRAARLLIPIARALDYAHKRGIVHRDIKPSNIMITESGEPMLTDFGVAKIIDEEATLDLTGTNATVGTPEYMAPEQVNSKTTDYRVDIYALGIVLYEMVTGRRPFEGDTPLATLFKQATDPLPRPSQFVTGIPNSIEKILVKTLAKKPVDRYQSMGEVANALDALLSGNVSAPNISRLKKESASSSTRGFGTASKRSIILWVSLAVVGVIFASILISSGTSRSGNKPDVVLNNIVSLTVVPLATHTFNLTNTPSPTNTKINTSTAVLVNTKTPLPTRTSVTQQFHEIVPGADITYQTDFNSIPDLINSWSQYGSVDIIDDILVIKNESGVKRNIVLKNGYGMLVLFRSSTDTDSNIVYFNSPDWANKYIGIKPSSIPKVSLGYDNAWHGGQVLSGNLIYETDHWYYALVEIRDGGEFYMKLVDKDNLNKYIEKNMPMGNSWENQNWYGSITTNQFNRGMIEVDMYLEYKIAP